MRPTPQTTPVRYVSPPVNVPSYNSPKPQPASTKPAVSPNQRIVKPPTQQASIYPPAELQNDSQQMEMDAQTQFEYAVPTEDMPIIRTFLDEVQTRISNLERNLDQIQEQLNNISPTVDFTPLQEKLDQINANFSSLQEKLDQTNIQENLKPIEDKLDRFNIHDDMVAIENEIRSCRSHPN